MWSQNRLSLVTGSVILNVDPSAKNVWSFQDRWPLMTVVSQDRFYCNGETTLPLFLILFMKPKIQVAV